MKKPDIKRCQGYRQFEKIHTAFCTGDIDALRAAVDDPAGIPNGPMPPGIGACLDYAIYHSALPLIRTLLEIGADPRPVDHAGFPPLIAALSCSLARPGAPARKDVIEVLRLLLAFGADPAQRGINDYSALRMAASVRNLPAVKSCWRLVRTQLAGRASTTAKLHARWPRQWGCPGFSSCWLPMK